MLARHYGFTEEELDYIINYSEAKVLFVGPDDCLSFRSGIPHRVQNISDEVGTYVWVNSPPSL